MNMNKKIGVFFGGRNAEHDISIVTGQFVISTLEKKGVDVVGVYVSKKGDFYLGEKISKLSFFKGDFDTQLEKLKKCSIELGNKKLVFKEPGMMGKSFEVGFAFPAFHGQFGEDGSVQGFFEFLNIPYAGCGVYTSSVAIDKSLTKDFFKNNNIPVSDYVVFDKKYFQNKKENCISQIDEKLEYPIFVKPIKQGSSIGISKVDKKEDLEDALELAFFYDSRVLLENGVKNIKDLTCAVLSNGQDMVVSEVQESVFADGFLDYEKKYMDDGGTQTGESESVQIPAKISDEITEKIKNYSLEVFEKLEGNGTMRIDFLLNTETQDLFLNEINTLPGTLYHHLWKKSGKDISEIIE